ncbi:MAG: SPOR domain-containing protein [Tannerella sp.]|jgi:cell division protein FtsN|nr:SPOR domain-containing protein [Tannerella sp.]
MNRLVEHIERLLLLHDCVIIPDFGGFVLQTIFSSHHADAGMFFPPKKEVVFNRSLTHNDGLLVESYMQMYDLNYNKAQLLVKNDVTLLKNTLENEGELLFGTTGVFVSDDERMVFMAAKNADIQYNISYYGLPIFHFLPLQNRKQPVSGAPVVTPQFSTVQPVNDEEEEENRNILYKIPVTKTFIRAAVAAAAAILLFLFITTPVKDVNKDSYKASFVPQELIPKKTADDIINEAFEKSQQSQNSNPEIAAQNPEVESEKPVDLAENTLKPETKPEAMPAVETKKAADVTANAAVASEKKSETAETKPASTKSASTTTAVKPAQPKNFYVIIGSFDTKARANRFIKTLKGQEAKIAGIHVSDGHFRVYLQGFVTETSANQYKDKLRQTTHHKDAWVYKVNK